MAGSQSVVAVQSRLEDPLAHLPRSNVVGRKKGQYIYRQDEPSTCIYLVIEGLVKVARLAPDGRSTIVDIYLADDFFGECALLGLAGMPEQATALEDTKLMAWTAADIGNIVQSRPQLATALLQIVVQRSLEHTQRIESFSLDNIERRLARTLVRLSQKLGVAEPDGSISMAPLTHELLGQFVGTSREVTTHYMNVLRREGYVRYSRRGIILYREALDEWLCRASTPSIRAQRAPRVTDGNPTGMPLLKRA